MTVGGYKLGPLLKNTGKEIIDDNVFGLASAMAYNFFFALFPLLLIIVPLIGIVAGPQHIADWIIAKFSDALPPDALKLVSGVIHQTVFAPSAPGLISLGAILTLWSGSNLFSGLMGALNTAYGAKETRPYWKRRLIAMTSVIVTGLLILIASVATLAGPQITNWIDNHTPVGHAFAIAWSIVQWPFAFAVLIVALWLAYYFLPCVRQNAKQVLVGATVAAALWIIVTLLFRFYVQNFGSYNKTYGAIGGVIILLTWMYLTMVATLAAGELNSALQQGVAAVTPRHGVTYAGRVVTTTEPSLSSTDRVVPARALAVRRP
ncbi:MAG TPA: YihY/virulence factor BrkB family protein [Gemmatimonadaceae bacterium]